MSAPLRVVLLTQDSYDARLFLKELVAGPFTLAGVVYERKKLSWKTGLRSRMEGLPVLSESKAMVCRATDNMNAEKDFIGSLKADCIIVVGTRKLKKEIYASARLGAINVHTGILPEYRGADSEFWALYEGKVDKIGITFHRLSDELDAGDILYQENTPVLPGDNYRTLHRKNLRLASKKIKAVIQSLTAGSAAAQKQNEGNAQVFRPVTRDFAGYLEKNKHGDDAEYKNFGDADMQVQELVAKTPSTYFRQKSLLSYPGTFCLRIDADEYHEPMYTRCMAVFKKYKEAVTIFYNAYSFSHVPNKVKEAAAIGLDVQSHSYYHATYGNYEGNRHNVRKALDFFANLGVQVKGFAAPTGRCNKELHRALCDEKQLYSSDFSYDYLGHPSHPQQEGQPMPILQIPVFPVAPELFLEKGFRDVRRIVDYFKKAIDEMDRCGIPVFVYGHTSHFEEIPAIYEEICDYAIRQKGLKPVSMTEFYRAWTAGNQGAQKKTLEMPAPIFAGVPAKLNFGRKAMLKIKKAIDFEMITPLNECRGPAIKILLKQLARARNRVYAKR